MMSPNPEVVFIPHSREGQEAFWYIGRNCGQYKGEDGKEYTSYVYLCRSVRGIAYWSETGIQSQFASEAEAREFLEKNSGTKMVGISRIDSRIDYPWEFFYESLEMTPSSAWPSFQLVRMPDEVFGSDGAAVEISDIIGIPAVRGAIEKYHLEFLLS
jgi:hypothetical protein